ncbi:hypothetical protein CFC21_003691 [Triticum aestivum]|uniref:Uncharacterized protein n=1 Tax=Triticum aestivum TaxID=4565 RepID=A0A3B5Y4Z8_WHEAT|nr:hypothetical protein CFC21_003691 [Triticum aestivum]
MKESSTAADHTIRVEEMEPQVFRAMLEFIYNDSEPKDKDNDDDAMWRWQHLLAAADRYDMQRLKLICEDKLCGFIEVNSTTAILSLAEQHCCDGLKKGCYFFLGTLGNLRAVAATDGFDDLIRNHPSVMKELITMLAPF